MPRLNTFITLALVCLQVAHWDQAGTAHALPVSAQVSRRIVAVGDLHSDYPQTLAVLRLANITDENANWRAGSDTLIQTGDNVDRGPGTIAIYQLFQKLRMQAKAAGGEVINLYGNHEIMNIGGDLRYVTKEDIASFGGSEKRKQAWDIRTGWLGQFVFNNFNISHIQHGHTLFSHADMHPDWASKGIDTMNTLAHDALWNKQYKAPIFTTDGPVWNRALAKQEAGVDATCEIIETIKEILGVKRLVSGHTVSKSGKILSLCNGSYLGIDVGITNYYGGNLAALEIIENTDGTQTVHALYPKDNTFTYAVRESVESL
ncbi:MAG: Metallo-dependent phosphatase-like protein [Benniella sp.]|nr:MAG: Metallo-dependent phosphatase-like protein [Benniella sp.]